MELNTTTIEPVEPDDQFTVGQQITAVYKFIKPFTDLYGMSRQLVVSKDTKVSTAYGEFTPGNVDKVLRWIQEEEPTYELNANSTFIDIGSGLGKIVFQVLLRYQVHESIGIEVVLDRIQASRQILHRIRTGLCPPIIKSINKELFDQVTLITGNITTNLQLLDRVTHVWMYDACFTTDTLKVVLPKINNSRNILVLVNSNKQQIGEDNKPVEEWLTNFRIAKAEILSMSGRKIHHTIVLYVRIHQ